MELDDYYPALEEEIGEILLVEERIPGVYHIESDQGKRFTQEYYAVLDTAPVAAKLGDRGKKIGNLLLFSWDDVYSGSKIIDYEVCKYDIKVRKKPVSEWKFREMSLHAMEVHPEYFGTFPVPFHTPHGHTLLHRTLANGVYWLETSKCKELLAVCFPIWSTELSPAAVSFCEILPWDIRVKTSTCYIFFPKEASCIPIYELMEIRGEWDGTIVDRPALMNAIWEFCPQYAMHLNGQKGTGFESAASPYWESSGIEPFPAPSADRMVCMYPDAGTDFLKLR